MNHELLVVIPDEAWSSPVALMAGLVIGFFVGFWIGGRFNITKRNGNGGNGRDR